MNSIRKLMIVILTGMALSVMGVSVHAEVIDYSIMTTDELKTVIDNNNKFIDKKSRKLFAKNNQCIALIQEKNGENNSEFIEKISKYTENIKIITDKIRRQKITCQNRSNRLQKSIDNNRVTDAVRKNQIRLINSQNRLKTSLFDATKQSKDMIKYLTKLEKKVSSIDRKLMEEPRGLLEELEELGELQQTM